MRGLSGLRVMITGAAGGIGRAVIDRLQAEGAVVMGVDMIDPPNNGLAFAGIADVTDEESVKTVFDSAVREVGGIDALVATAGIQITKPTHELSVAEFRKVLDVSVIGTFVTTKYVIPHMLAAGGGRIVTFGSTAAIRAAPKMSAYAAAKGAVLQYTQSIAVEYGGQGIRSNCICPGGTLTAMMKEIDANVHGADSFLARHPIGRYADPSEIAAGVAFLISDDSSFVLGANFMVDGGYTMA